MNRTLIYVHFNPNQALDGAVLEQLKRIKSLFNQIIFISNSDLTLEHQKTIQELLKDKLKRIELRPNQGFDFAAWKEGLAKVDLREVDSLTLMNDTCFGPFYDLETFYQENETNKQVDFFGISGHPKAKISEGHWIDEHLQSYFMVFKSNVLNSSVFSDFWNSVTIHDHVQSVIDQYEIGLTRQLTDAGFHYQTLLPMSTGDDSLVNMMMERPEQAIWQGSPFIKIKAFSHQPERGLQSLIYLKENESFPFDLMLTTLTSRTLPIPSYLIPFKTIKSFNKVEESTERIYLNFYLKYPGDFLMLSDYIKKYGKEKILVTTDNLDLKQACQELGIDDIIFLNNNNLTDWLRKLANHLEEDDWVCHINYSCTEEGLQPLVVTREINQRNNEINFKSTKGLDDVGLLLSEPFFSDGFHQEEVDEDERLLLETHLGSKANVFELRNLIEAPLYWFKPHALVKSIDQTPGIMDGLTLTGKHLMVLMYLLKKDCRIIQSPFSNQSVYVINQLANRQFMTNPNDIRNMEKGVSFRHLVGVQTQLTSIILKRFWKMMMRKFRGD